MSGSPFALEVLAGPPRGANATASGSALALATAGENSSFIIQARDRQANPAATTAAEDRTVSETSASFAWTGNEYEDLFNVTLTRTRGDAQDMGDDDAWDNSTIFHAVVEPLGKKKVAKQHIVVPRAPSLHICTSGYQPTYTLMTHALVLALPFHEIFTRGD